MNYKRERAGTTKDHSVKAMQEEGSATFEDLTTLTPEDLAETLVGPGVTIVPDSVSYTGANEAAGTFEFTEDDDVIGISSGIVLSSGRIIDAEGPNTSPSTSTAFTTPGDPDLTALSGFTTFDAAVLEFDFEVEPGTERVTLRYVFGSEEYNEFVSSEFNDVFAFWVNEVNFAVVNGDPVSINTINNGQPNVSPTNPQLYINNDPFHPDATGETVPQEELLHTEMDGFTVVLDFEAPVDPTTTNTMRIAIADATDRIYDSWVFIEEGSFVPVDDELSQLLCVEFQATFEVDIDCEVTDVTCLGECPPENNDEQ